MGFRECVAEVARYMTNVEGLDMKDPMRVRLLNHLENYLAQRELAINAAVAASAQMGVPKITPPPPPPTLATGIAIQHTPGPFIPIPAPQRGSPEGVSPTEGGRIPISMALPTPVISFAPTATVPVFGATPIASIGTPHGMPIVPIATKMEGPVSPIKKHTPSPTANNTTSPSSTTKLPFRPWADADD